MKNPITQELYDRSSFYFINKPINKQDEQSEWASDIYERYKEPNKEILNTIDSLVKIQAGNKKGDPYKTEIEKENQEQLMSMLTGGDFACIDYYVKQPKPKDSYSKRKKSYHQYVFVNQKHLQIRIKSYKEKGEPSKCTIGFYKDNPIDWDEGGPKLKIMDVPKEDGGSEEDFVFTNQGNEIAKYSNGFLITAFKNDNSVVGWDLRIISEDTQIEEIYKKISKKIKSYNHQCENIKKYIKKHFGNHLINYIRNNRMSLHGKNLEEQNVKGQIKKVLEDYFKKNVVDEPGQSPDSTKQIDRIISEIILMVMEENLIREGNKILEDAKEYLGEDVSFDVFGGTFKLKNTKLKEQGIKNQVKKVLIESYKNDVMGPAHMSLNIDSDTMKEELGEKHKKLKCGNEKNNKSSLTRFSMFKHKDHKPESKVKSLHNGHKTPLIYERKNKKLIDLTSQQGP